MCERGAVTPDVSCTAEHQSTTMASHQSTIFVNCELSRLEMWCCCAYFAVLYILVCINISWCLFPCRLGLNHQLLLLLVDVASPASLSCFVTRSLIGNIAFSFIFHCMNLVDCIFWICILVLFLVMCCFIFPSLCLVM